MEEFFDADLGIYYRKNLFSLDRPSMVFVHGLSGSSSAWLEYEEFFKTHYNILSFDLRGHGKSAKPKKYSDYTVSLFANDLFLLVTKLELRNFVLVGHSFGSMVVLEFMANHADRVSKLILLSPSASINRRIAAKLIKPFFALTKILQFLPFKGKPGKHIDYTQFKNTGDWNISRMLADVGNTTWRIYFYVSGQSYNFDRESLLSAIQTPTLVVHGKKDSIFPVENGVLVANHIKNSKLVLLENSDHIIVLNNFSEVSEAMVQFLQN